MSATRLGINARGGGNYKFRQIIADQTGGFTDYGIIGQTKLTLGNTEEEVPDDRGKLIDVVELLQQSMVEFIQRQTRKADLDQILATKGLYFSYFYTVLLRTSATTYQHIFVPMVRFSRNVNLPYGPEKRELSVKVNILAPLGGYSYPAAFPQYQDFDLSIVDGALTAAPTADLPTTSHL